MGRTGAGRPEPPRGVVLVVEDEDYVRDSLGEMLRARGYATRLAASIEAAGQVLSRSPVDVVLTDLRLGGSDGLDLIRRLRATSPDTPVVVLTGFGTVGSAVECIRAGASDYLLKPAEPGALEVAIERALASRALQREVRYLRGSPAGPGGEEEEPVGNSAAWLRVMSMARSAAQADSTVLLLGESGTGKEVLARLIHRLSPRARGPYVRVNCAAVPLEMWESEFFGHRKGAYTGASADREGRFHLAHGGTLFMDEIGAMPLAAQAKILRVVDTGEFDRLGDDEPTRVDVRVIAATNSDLEAEAAAGRFRRDLLYRLDVVRIEVPPLRDRPEDVPLLARRFLAEISARLGRPAPRVSDAALAELQAYPWPGNARELRNVIERALVLESGDTVDSFHPFLSPVMASAAPAGGPPAELGLRDALLRREREVVLEAVRRSGGVRKEAARLLGVDPRNLGYYLRKHGIDPDQVSD